MADDKTTDSRYRKKQQKRQERLAIALGVGIIAASVASTVWLSGVFGGGSRAAYENVTFADAVIRCESQVRNTYKDRLRVLTLDDHSSRFDQTRYLYKVFFRAQMAGAKGETGAADYFINCFVSSERGGIASFDLYQQEELQTEALRREEGGLFGWPLKNSKN